jgi:ubiquinone/menaquinone biosynthesis C-methylase UbiE
VIPQAALDDASRVCWERGIKVLQGFRCGNGTDRQHIGRLLWAMSPPFGSRWVDIGCGFGEPARLMAEFRPDLHFELVNNNQFQLTKVPRHLPAYHADMHELPFEDARFDGAMFLYSLCHSDGLAALHEAARVVKPGGKLFVFDYIRKSGDNDLARWHLGANFFTRNEFLTALCLAGWAHAGWNEPPGSDALFRSTFGDGQQPQLYDQIFSEVTPTIWLGYKPL